MVSITINDTPISVDEGTTILDAAKSADISIPTLCYFKDLCDIGACRVCCVEVEGEERLSAACNTPVRDGMVIHTNSDRAETTRKTNLELIVSRHNLDCPHCVRFGTCRLQALLKSYGLAGPDRPPEVFTKELPQGKRAFWDPNLAIQRDASKCIQCGRCVATCNKIQGIGVWEFSGTGSRSSIGITDHRSMMEAGCVSCGQCITHCPVGALSERDDIARLRAAIADPDITTVVQIAPATRTAWASAFGEADGDLGVERMCAALKEMGVDYVFDTVFTADLTIMEEGTELLNIIKSGNTERLPLFTSCCPGWVRFARNRYPETAAHLSSAKSPMQMFGAVIKTWFAEKNNLDPAKIFSVALMPCTAKKDEIQLPHMSAHPPVPDMDASLTTREFVRMIKQDEIDVTTLADQPLDNPLDVGTGAGVIFGVTGGVMEAALRTAAAIMTGENPEPRGFEFTPAEAGPWKEAVFDLAGTPIHCAVVHGLNNTDQLIAAVDAGKVSYDFIEVMACPTGCAGGGGQPIDGSDRELGAERGIVLRKLDDAATIRFSHENPIVQTIYKEYFDAPCSEKAERYLHTHA